MNDLINKSKAKFEEMTAKVNVEDVKEQSADMANAVLKMADGSLSKAKIFAKEASDKIKEIEIKPEDVLGQALKVPGVKIQRSEFLYKELIRYYPEEQVMNAIKTNPAQAGIERERINKIADYIIDYETNKVSAISFASGIPGGIAMAATIPADVAQYFGFLLRVMQKLAYLYGFGDFEMNENEISDDTMNQMLIFLGVMFGVNGANQGVRIIAETFSKKLNKTLAHKAFTKTAYYPIVKKVATTLGFKMTKDIFSKGASKVVPLVGGVVSGGLTYLSFKPCAIKLKKSFQQLDLSDPQFYEKEAMNI